MKNLLLRRILLFFIILFSHLIFSQQKDNTDLALINEEGDRLFKIANDFFGENSDSTKFYMELAAKEFEKSENWKMYVSCFNTISICYFFFFFFEGFYKYYQEALRMVEQYLPKNSNELYYSLFNLFLSFTERG
ncbi:MAG: hypothetical protein AB8H03_02525, partial [Saprospiraceae bacterium]